MVLYPQAAIDDSKTTRRHGYCVLGGFIAPAAAWARFSDEWQAALDLKPRLEYFKMNEANTLTGQFDKKKGWTEQKRNGRLLDLAQVIGGHVSLRVYSAVHQSLFEHYIASIPLTYRSLASDDPYIYLTIALMSAVSTRSYRFGLNEPCEFIFDTQSGHDTEIYLRWETIKKIAGQFPRSNTFGHRPKFEKDEDFKPLQAADLYAGLVRAHYERNSRGIIVPPSTVLQRLLHIPEISHESTDLELRGTAEAVLKAQKEILAANPNALVTPFAATARERRIIRERVRKAGKPRPSSRRRPS